MKYDGSRVYRAGMPEPASLGLPTSVTASSSTKEYFYGVIYEFTDAMGNVISSRMKTASVIELSRC